MSIVAEQRKAIGKRVREQFICVRGGNSSTPAILPNRALVNDAPADPPTGPVRGVGGWGA